MSAPAPIGALIVVAPNGLPPVPLWSQKPLAQAAAAMLLDVDISTIPHVCGKRTKQFQEA